MKSMILHATIVTESTKNTPKLENNIIIVSRQMMHPLHSKLPNFPMSFNFTYCCMDHL